MQQAPVQQAEAPVQDLAVPRRRRRSRNENENDDVLQFPMLTTPEEEEAPGQPEAPM